MSEAEELASNWCGTCTCHNAYTFRNMIDPSCLHHNDYDDLVKLLLEYGAIVRKREWVGLTDEEAAACWSTSAVQTWKNFEAKLRSKNGY